MKGETPEGKARAMTMTEMRKAYKAARTFAENTQGLEELAWYYDSVKRTLETLWKYGTTTDFDKDFLKVANGYQIGTGDYEGIQILQTLDLHRITATKNVVKELAERFFG